MSRSLFLILFLLLCRMVLYCQADSLKPEPYVYFNAFSVIAGFGGTESQSHPLDYYKQKAPNNAVANLAPDNAEFVAGNGNTGNGLFNLGVNIHLKTKDFKTSLGSFSSEWRAGLNIATSIMEKTVFSNTIMMRSDTFYSEHTSMIKYEGKTSEDIYQYKYKSKNVYLDISKTYHTNQLKRLSFYTGINVGVGCTFNNRLAATFITDTTSERRRRYFSLEDNDGAVTQTSKLKSEVYYNTTIPVGLVLRRVSKRKQKAYPFSFFAEGRLGYRFQKDHGSKYNKIPFGAILIGTKIYFHCQNTGQ